MYNFSVDILSGEKYEKLDKLVGEEFEEIERFTTYLKKFPDDINSMYIQLQFEKLLYKKKFKDNYSAFKYGAFLDELVNKLTDLYEVFGSKEAMISRLTENYAEKKAKMSQNKKTLLELITRVKVLNNKKLF